MKTEHLDEEMAGTSTADVAAGPGQVLGNTRRKPHFEFRGEAGFNIKDAHEFHSFAQGVKKFHHWRKHTSSEDIRHWAKENPKKDFYIKHNDHYYKVTRGKKKMVEHIEEITDERE